MLLTRNSKIKKSEKRTFNFGMPAYKSASGFITCPNAAACAEGCYALAGAYRFSNVERAFERRLEAAQSPDFIQLMLREIDVNKAERIRIHDSADFFSQEYLYKWLTIMELRPNVEFYAYTKMVSMIKKLTDKLPKNFTVIFSFGGTEDHLIDVNNDRHSLVFENVEQLKAAGYADASEQDDVALGANPKIGLVYHGTKNIENTNWQKVKQFKKAV